MQFKTRAPNGHAGIDNRGTRGSTVIRIGLIVAMLASAYIIIRYASGVREELSTKPVYAALQQLEIRYRNQALPTPARIVTTKDLHVIVLRSGDAASPYVWVATNKVNETTEDGVFHVGDVSTPETPCRTLAPVLNDPTTLASVKTYLRRNCRL